MIIVKIVGGLGNQMFQYSYAKSLQVKGYEVKIDVSAFDTYSLHGGYQLDQYNIKLNKSEKNENSKFHVNPILLKILKKIGLDFSNNIKEESLLFDEKLLKISGDKYVDGYFQSEQYFKEIRTVLLEDFSIVSNLSEYTKGIEKKIMGSSLTSCSIHIRRGDFINTINSTIHGACDLEYYQQAIEYMDKKNEDIKYYIFSDDIDWCKENFKSSNINYIASKESRIPHEDIYLMSLCNHNIIANSSFSWWGAWLNENNEKIVIAPNRWFISNMLNRQAKDIIPKGWKKI